jgi:hypothetical protein
MELRMSSRSWVTSSLASRPLGLERADAALADVVRGEPQPVVAAVAAEFQQLAAGRLRGAVLRAGPARPAREAGPDGVAALVRERFRHVRGDSPEALLAGGRFFSARSAARRC